MTIQSASSSRLFSALFSSGLAALAIVPHCTPGEHRDWLASVELCLAPDVVVLHCSWVRKQERKVGLEKEGREKSFQKT